MTARTVLLIDDGLATGATMRAALSALRREHPAKLIAAVPIGPPETCQEMAELADEVICALMPEPFVAVGRWYEDFSETTDDEVLELLARAEARAGHVRS